jgi:hypothetical protein
MKRINVKVQADYDIHHNESLDSEWVANHFLETSRFSTERRFGDRYNIVCACSSIEKVWSYDNSNKLPIQKQRNVKGLFSNVFKFFVRKDNTPLTNVESAHYRIINKTTGEIYPFDYRSEAEDFYKTLIDENGHLYEYEMSVLLKQYQPPEMLNVIENADY